MVLGRSIGFALRSVVVGWGRGGVVCTLKMEKDLQKVRAYVDFLGHVARSRPRGGVLDEEGGIVCLD